MQNLEQGRSLKKKNLELEYPFLLIAKAIKALPRLFTWVFYNPNVILLVALVALVIVAIWGLGCGVLR